MSQKQIQRHYLAIVAGTINDYKVHTLTKPIGHDRHHNQKMIIATRGKIACTHYQKIATNDNLTLIECTLDTGRKHQIRVHMASVHLPLLGDKLYNQESPLINRQALHAYQLQFIHPITEEKMTLL